jgi:adenylylsulfate kinase-like enzyme
LPGPRAGCRSAGGCRAGSTTSPRSGANAGCSHSLPVARPVEVCQQRDCKGLYAKARAGLIKQFTRVSDPYQEPTDAALVIDTSVTSREDATEAIMAMLIGGGWLTLENG